MPSSHSGTWWNNRFLPPSQDTLELPGGPVYTESGPGWEPGPAQHGLSQQTVGDRTERNAVQDPACGRMFISVATGVVCKRGVCQHLREVVPSQAPSNHIACHNPDVPYSPSPRGLEHAVSLHGLPFLQTVFKTHLKHHPLSEPSGTVSHRSLCCSWPLSSQPPLLRIPLTWSIPIVLSLFGPAVSLKTHPSLQTWPSHTRMKRTFHVGVSWENKWADELGFGEENAGWVML